MAQKRQCDVLVVGAGVAGVSAAVASARKGFDVILVERHEFLGGTAANTMNRHVCGIYPQGQENPPGLLDTLNDDITKEFASFLGEQYGVKNATAIGRVFVLSLPEQGLSSFLIHALKPYRNVLQEPNAEVIGVQADQDRIVQVDVQKKGAVSVIVPSVVIDCSGESVMSRLSGIPCLEEDLLKRQLAGYCLKVTGIDPENERLQIEVPYACGQYVDANDAARPLKYTKFLAGDHKGEGFLKINFFCADGPQDSQQARYVSMKVFDYLTGHLPAFAHAEVVQTSQFVSHREGARLEGGYLLQEDDVLRGRTFEDAAVKAAWPIERWTQEKGVQYQYIEEDGYYEIPQRCLQSRHLSNLLAAGRCLSASSEALGSARVMGTCMSLGEAAGCMAAEMITK